jgi:hypothetical protein
MKGSMVFSLITLCVVMLFMEARISRFLHGEREAAAQDSGFLPDMAFLAEWGEAVTGVWADGTDLLASASAAVMAAADNKKQEKVVITEDTLQQVWVWREKGAIQSARDEPARADARQVMIPEDMTAREFFAEKTSDDKAERTAQPSQADAASDQAQPAVEDNADNAATLDELSPEERRAMLDQGMETLQKHSAASDKPAAR